MSKRLRIESLAFHLLYKDGHQKILPAEGGVFLLLEIQEIPAYLIFDLEDVNQLFHIFIGDIVRDFLIADEIVYLAAFSTVSISPNVSSKVFPAP